MLAKYISMIINVIIINNNIIIDLNTILIHNNHDYIFLQLYD